MSVFDNENLNNFLSTGAFISMNDGTWLLAWNDKTNYASRNCTGASFYLSEFFEESGRWQEFLSSVRLPTDEICRIFKQNLKDAKDEKEVTSQVRSWQEPDFDEFANYFKRFKEDGGLEKVVPVVFSESDGQPNLTEKVRILIKLLELPPDVYAYGYWDDSENVGFVGASPELLFSRKGSQISTMALAGTSQKGETSSLLEDPKEQKEHSYVIEDINQKLSNCRLQWQLTHEWEVGNLKHLRTYSTGHCEWAAEDLINRLHPTSALGGAPGRLPMSKMAEYCNANKRKFFGAPFGVRTEKEELIIVSLRNIQWFDGKTYLGSGCGLIKESSLEKEWKELGIKRSFTRSFLNI